MEESGLQRDLDAEVGAFLKPFVGGEAGVDDTVAVIACSEKYFPLKPLAVLIRFILA